MTVIVGVDPDSDRHGIAIYRDGQLCELHQMSLVDVRKWIETQPAPASENLFFSIENVLAQNFVYTRNAKSRKAAHAKVALSIGRCQQAQAELMRELESQGIKFEVHAPTGHNWADNKDRFERQTGWSARSNSDTRSAAFFGWIACNRRGNYVTQN